MAQIGIAEGTLYRDEGYVFYRLGMLIERADQTSRLIDVKSAEAALSARSADQSAQFVFWSTILRTAGAYQVFHRHEPASPDAERVARFLILNPSHPRSIGFCAREINDALQSLRSAYRLHKANAGLEACDVLIDGLQAAGQDAELKNRLHDFNDWVQRALMALTQEIAAEFFGAPRSKPRTMPPAPPPPAAAGPGSRQDQRQSSQA